LASGTTLNIADIAQDLQVSPSPVREAVLRLTGEGLVTNPTNRRATVTSFTRQDVIEVFQVRSLLECGAVRLAARHIEKHELQELRQAVEQCAVLYGDPAQKMAMFAQDNRFHLLIAKFSRNRALHEEIVRVSRRVRVMQWLRLDPMTMNRGYPEHLAVIEGLERHDADGAVAAMDCHIRLAGELVVAALDAARPR
jgi:DNA-binding GntR family transcriptional regulator